VKYSTLPLTEIPCPSRPITPPILAKTAIVTLLARLQGWYPSVAIALAKILMLTLPGSGRV
jgi:hypothetical protein